MSVQINLYSKPQNKYNLKERFYNLYLNKNTNLDLSAISNFEKTLSINSSTNSLKNKKEFPVKKDNASTTKEKKIFNKLMELQSLESQILEEQHNNLNKFLKFQQERYQKLINVTNQTKQLFQNLQQQSNEGGEK